MLNPRFVAGVLIFVLMATTSAFAQQAPAGRIKVVSGSVLVVRAGRTSPAEIGQVVYQADSLRTGADGRVGITLSDDTRLSLGPASEARLDQFTFAPAEGKVGLVLNIVRGIVAYVSGRIAKLSPDSVKLETPTAIVGVRGTTLAIRVAPE